MHFRFSIQQLAKLRIALDSATTAHANLATSTAGENVNKSDKFKINQLDAVRTPSDTNLLLQTKPPSCESTPTRKSSKESQHDIARNAFLLGQSEERVQILSIIMLHLCTGLQYAQELANQ